MKHLKLYPKTFFYTLGLMLFIVLVAHGLLYFLTPQVPLDISPGPGSSDLLVTGKFNLTPYISQMIQKVLPISLLCCVMVSVLCSLLFSRQGEVKVPQDIGVMACKAGLMVRQAISSYTGRDVETAHAVVNLDDEVDELFRKIKGDLINQVADNLDEADLSIDFIIIAKYLERIADHAVNIAQWAIFCVTGEL